MASPNPPVVLFAFKRPQHTQQVISALSKQSVCPEHIIAFIDGARSSKEEVLVAEVHDIIKAVQWTETEIVARETNYGVKRNIVSGLTDVMRSYSRAVILEDDIVPSPIFYEAMCSLLENYKDTKNVFSVGGYPTILRDSIADYPYDVVMSPRFSCWGWATWADRWSSFSEAFGTIPALIETMPEKELEKAGADVPMMALNYKSGASDSWAVPATIYCVANGLIHALTKNCLVENTDHEHGTHEKVRPSRAYKRFLEYNAAVFNQLPDRFPEATLSPSSSDMVNAYVKAHAFARAGGIPGKIGWLKRRAVRKVKHYGREMRNIFLDPDNSTK